MTACIMDQEKKSIDEVRIKSNLLTNFVRFMIYPSIIGNTRRTQQKSRHKRRLMNLKLRKLREIINLEFDF